MQESEKIQDFYRRSPESNPEGLSMNNANPGHFNVFARSQHTINTPYRRRDFYKISLLIGRGRLHHADKWIDIDRAAIVFSNPLVAYAWETGEEMPKGWFCLFTESFLQPSDRIGKLGESPLFQAGGAPVLFLNPEQQAGITQLFEKMVQEMASDYAYKYDVLRNYLHLLIHETMKIAPASEYHRQTNSAARITSLFNDLLERQFPIDTQYDKLEVKTPQDFARQLNVHVNTLNRAVKETTGRTTSALIAARVVREAGILLEHSQWNISEIAYSLGFEYPAYFTRFFRKHTGQVPMQRRQGVV